jgi:hypothetical protein
LSDTTPSIGNADDSDYDARSPKQMKFDIDQEEKENRLQADGTRIFLVSEQQLKQLFQCCPKGHELLGEPVIYAIGVDVRVETYCQQCSVQKWTTFPLSEGTKLHEGNGRLTAATIVSGNTFEDVNSIANNLNLQIMTSITFRNYAKKWVYPAVDEVYIQQKKEFMDEVIRRQRLDRNAYMDLAVNGRFSRPGHTATFAIVSALDLATNKIFDSAILKKNDPGVTSSPNMEIVGTRRLLLSFNQTVGEAGDEPSTSAASTPAVRVGRVVTDDNVSVIKMMKNEFSDIKHCGDAWHLLKSIRKRLEEKAKRASCRELKFWIKSIDNFLWTAMKKCGGDGDLLVEQWR